MPPLSNLINETQYPDTYKLCLFASFSFLILSLVYNRLENADRDLIFAGVLRAY